MRYSKRNRRDWRHSKDDEPRPKGDMKKKPQRPSPNADNYKVCPKAGRMKYHYETIEKALKACQFAPDPQRPYYCKACRCFHTTSKTKDEYYEQLEQTVGKRYESGISRTRHTDPIKKQRLKKMGIHTISPEDEST